jgi:ABC-type oligopeptide transport system substrate-binding subunit
MRRTSKWSLWAIAAGVIAVVVAGSAIGAADQKAQNLREIIGAEPPSLDPGLATDTTSANIVLNINEPLVKLGPLPDLKPVPTAAESWTVKGSTVTFNLRKEVRWTNGQPVTAADYVWSWKRTLSPELAADYAYQLFGIKGAAEYNSCDPAKANCAALAAAVGVKAAGKYKLVVTLTSPQPWFIQQVSHHSFLPVHRATVEKYGDKWTEPGNIVTDGPFKLASWKHDASLTLVKNTKWRDAKSVKLNQVTLTIITDGTTAVNSYVAGNADVNSQSLPPAEISKWRKNPEYKTYVAIGTYYYGFNVKNIPDVNQRRAMAVAIDRKAIIKYIAQGGQKVARTFTPVTIAGAPIINKNAFLPVTGQLAKAKQYMAKVKNLTKDVNLYMNNSPGHIQIATAVQAFWKELGLNVTLKVQEWKQYLEFLGPPPNADVSAYRLGWIYDYPDAMNGLELWTCDSGNNNTNWCNTTFDATIEKARNTPNTAARYLLYQKAETILTGENGPLPLMPIYHYVFHALVKPYVKGWALNPQDQVDYTVVSVSK